jgi:glyoxylase I family protein
VKTKLAISGYSHVSIAVTDLDAARTFYCDVLGLDEAPRPDLGFPGMWLQVGGLQLHFLPVDEMAPNKGFTHFAVHVPPEEFVATMVALESEGVTFVGKPSSRVDFGQEVWQAFISDPAGNIIELTDDGGRLPVAKR